MSLTSLLTLAGLLAVLAAVIFHQVFWPGIRLQRIRRREFPAAWEPLLRRALPIYAGMHVEQQQQLKQLIKQFIADKHFIGCGGQIVDDEIRISIAANACLLLLNRETGCYPQLQSVLVYPSTFVVSHEEHDEFGLVSTYEDELEGEAWSDGKIVLAWDDVKHGISNFSDGHNVVLHEFAHALDHEDGEGNGAPLLRTRGAYKNWARVFAAEFALLQQRADRGQDSLMDQYGASDPAEFFAVATETFFEKPREMQAHHAELYQELVSYYQVDPVQWVKGGIWIPNEGGR